MGCPGKKRGFGQTLVDTGRRWHLRAKEGALDQILSQSLRNNGPQTLLSGLPGGLQSHAGAFRGLSCPVCGVVPQAQSCSGSVGLELSPERGEKPPPSGSVRRESAGRSSRSTSGVTRTTCIPGPSLVLCLTVSHLPSRSTGVASAENITNPPQRPSCRRRSPHREHASHDLAYPQQRPSLRSAISIQPRQGIKERKSHQIYHQTENKDISR